MRSPDQLRLCTGGEENATRLWNLVTGRPLSLPLRQPSWVSRSQFTPDCRCVLTRSSWNNGSLCDAEDGSARPLMFARQSVILDGNFAPDGQQLVLGWSDGMVELCDPRHGGRIRKLEGLRSAARLVLMRLAALE